MEKMAAPGAEESKICIGIEGADELRTKLCKSNPKSAIPQFQQENTLVMPSAVSIISLLDLMQINRNEIFRSVLNTLRDSLLQHIETADEDHLKQLLQKAFRYITIDEFRPICIAVMEKLNRKIPIGFLSKLAQQPTVLTQLPKSLQRLVWEKNLDVYRVLLTTSVNEYTDNYPAIFSANSVLPSDRRAASHSLQTIICYIGHSSSLFTYTADFLRQSYSGPLNFALSTLRLDLVMSIPDGDAQSFDPLFQFAWCLDACSSLKQIGDKAADEIDTYMNHIQIGDPIVADMAIVLGNPTIMCTILNSLLDCVRELMLNEVTIKRHSRLQSLTRLAFLALGVSDIICNKQYKYPEVPPVVYKLLFPKLVAVLSSLASNQHSVGDIDSFIMTHKLFRMLLLHYSLFSADTVLLSLLPRFRQVFPKLCRLHDEPLFVSLFIAKLSERQSLNDEMRIAVLEFFMSCCHQNSEDDFYVLSAIHAIAPLCAPIHICNYLRQLIPNATFSESDPRIQPLLNKLRQTHSEAFQADSESEDGEI